mmetsp:Transcript_19148/g.22136  ORF Transcript_19148/g.22136 Transcript_19148/m.22136 type:complete len:405 (-) Transcript_19148:174-1388(-)
MSLQSMILRRRFVFISIFCLLCLCLSERIASCTAFMGSTVTSLPSLRRNNIRNNIMSLLSSPSAEEEAQRLLDQATKIRQQLADLEGKSVEQVEEEAKQQKTKQQERLQLNEASTQKKNSNKAKNKQKSQSIYVPQTIEEQSNQAALAIERAFQDGITRQTVRLALVKEDTFITPEEEEWPGGTKQMYREAGRPLTEALLSEIRATAKDIQTEKEKKSGKESFVPQIKTQDIWDFDGSAIITAEAAQGPSGDVQALVFPNTDVKYLNDISQINEQVGKERLFLLINPFWRNVESWGFNILAPNAKRKAQEVIFDCVNGGFQETYVLSRFSVRGEDCVALKVYPNDWQLFAYYDDFSYGYGNPVQTTIQLGSSEHEPNSAMFSKFLNERDEFKMNKTMRQLNRKF